MIKADTGAYLNQMFSTRTCQIKGEGLDPLLRNTGLTMFFLLETAELSQVSELKAWCACFVLLCLLTVKCNSVCSNKNWCQE